MVPSIHSKREQAYIIMYEVTNQIAMGYNM